MSEQMDRLDKHRYIRREGEYGTCVCGCDVETHAKVLWDALEHAECALATMREAFAVSGSDEENRLRVQLVEDDRLIASLRTRLAEAEAKYEHDRGLFAQIVDDLFDGMECDASCDDYSHGETCPTTLGPEAVKSLRAKLTAAERRGQALLAVARAVHNDDGLTACSICGRIRHPAGCDCPVAKLDAVYPGWRTEWRHGRPHDARTAWDHEEEGKA